MNPASTVDSSDEEGAHLESTTTAPIRVQPPGVSTHGRTIGTQTIETMSEVVYAESSSITVVELQPQKLQFWDHFLSCMKMPRGGLNGTGSQHCEFEFICANERIVQYLMEDLPLRRNMRYNLSLPHNTPPNWESSPTINTYYAETLTLIDSYMRLHRRESARGFRAYRGSVLAAPPGTYQSPVAMLSVCPPLLMELCHRKHGKLVLCVSFNLCVMNDANLLTTPPKMRYAVGMDALLQIRCMNHLRKLQSRKESMSIAFGSLAAAWQSSLTDSEGEWADAFQSADADENESDEEEVKAQAAATSKSKRHRAKGSRWEGVMRA